MELSKRLRARQRHQNSETTSENEQIRHEMSCSPKYSDNDHNMIIDEVRIKRKKHKNRTAELKQLIKLMAGML